MPERRTERAEAILDAATELLTRWGYRRVTVDEVARRADIGKGTVYLHWRSRDEVLFAVLLREGARLLDALAQGIRADPAEIMLHRYVRAIFVRSMRNPLLAAIYTRDGEVLGKLVATGNTTGVTRSKLTLSGEYLGLLAEHSLLRTDLSMEQVGYGIGAAIFGHLAMDPLLPPEMDFPLDTKADLLAAVVRNAFEPARRPSKQTLAAIAPKIVGILEQLRDTYSASAYQTNDSNPNNSDTNNREK